MIRRTEIETIPFEPKKLLEIVSRNEFANGEFLDLLVSELAERFQRKYCVLCSSGSAALLLSIISIKPAARVLVPAASTCYSIPNSVIAAGGVPVFCDLDLRTGNLSESEAERIFQESPYDLVISPNHFGIPSDLGLFDRLGIPVIEDGAQSAMTNAVCGIRGEVGILSFYPTKYLNGMDGGVILTDDETIFRNASDRVYYNKQSGYDGHTRFNLRLGNLNAYLAQCSLSKLPEMIPPFSKLYHEFAQRCSRVGIDYLHSQEDFIPHRFVIKMRTRAERDRMLGLLRENGIEAAIELMMVSKTGDEPCSNELTQTTMSLPFHQQIADADIDKIFGTLEDGIRGH